MAQVVVKPEVLRQLADLPRPILQRVTRFLELLREWPNVSGCKPLSGELAGSYRKRTGDYRIQSFVNIRQASDSDTATEHKVVVTKIGHRDGFYGD